MKRRNPLFCRGLYIARQLLSSLFFSEGDGTRTRNHRIDSPEPAVTNPRENQGETPQTGPWLPPGCQPQTEPTPSVVLTDPELGRVLTAWPELPPHIRAAILALVGSAIQSR